MRLFEDNYTEIGNSSENLILKTKGKIKIQWNKKFIDLIDSNGNIANQFKIKAITDINNIKQEGIYYKEGSIYIKISGQDPIEITGDSSANSVSYQKKQITSNENKLQALENIGFYYKTLEEIPEGFEGITYIENEKALYIISNNSKKIFQLNLVNPYSNQIKIQKNTSEKGSLVIIGKGINNGIILDNFQLYLNNENYTIFDSNSNQLFSINQSPILELSLDGIKINSIKSFDENFFIKKINGEYVLQVDKILGNKNIIDTIYINSGLNTILNITKEENYYNLSLNYFSSYNQGDILIVTSQNEQKIEFLVEESTINSKTVKVSNNDNFDLENVLYCYCFLKNDSGVNIGKLFGNNFGIISQNNIFYKTQYKDYPEYSDNLYNNIQSELQDTIIPPYGIIKNLITNLQEQIDSLKERLDNLEETSSN